MDDLRFRRQGMLYELMGKYNIWGKREKNTKNDIPKKPIKNGIESD